MGHIFDPKQLHEIAKRAVGLPHKEMCDQVIREVHDRYPEHTETRQEWVFNFAAGAKGVMTILHASFTEYLIIFGTPIGTEGFSGRYRLDIYDFLLAGEMWTYLDDNIGDTITTKPGEMALLRRDQTKGFKLPVGSWMLEYGRGAVPTALPLALSDAIFSCMDPHTVVRTLARYSKLVVKELLQGKI